MSFNLLIYTTSFFLGIFYWWGWNRPKFQPKLDNETLQTSKPEPGFHFWSLFITLLLLIFNQLNGKINKNIYKNNPLFNEITYIKNDSNCNLLSLKNICHFYFKLSLKAFSYKIYGIAAAIVSVSKSPERSFISLMVLLLLDINLQTSCLYSQRKNYSDIDSQVLVL